MNQGDVTLVARDRYATYCASSNGLNYQGLPCPAWGALTEAVRGHWSTVARRDIASSGMPPTEVLGNGEIRLLPPGDDVFGHLPDPAAALATWRKYSGHEIRPAAV